jgi:hypothetical protein
MVACVQEHQVAAIMAFLAAIAAFACGCRAAPTSEQAPSVEVRIDAVSADGVMPFAPVTIVYPTIRIWTPSNAEIVAPGRTVIAGHADGGIVVSNSDTTVAVDGREIAHVNGWFCTTVSLPRRPGMGGATVVARNELGYEATEYVKVLVDTEVPPNPKAVLMLGLKCFDTVAGRGDRKPASDWLVAGTAKDGTVRQAVIDLAGLTGEAPGCLPAGARIVSAHLRLCVASDEATDPREITVRLVTDEPDTASARAGATATVNRCWAVPDDGVVPTELDVTSIVQGHVEDPNAREWAIAAAGPVVLFCGPGWLMPEERPVLLVKYLPNGEVGADKTGN